MTTDKRNEKSSPIRPRKLSDNKKYPPMRQSKEVVLVCFAGHQRDHFYNIISFLNGVFHCLRRFLAIWRRKTFTAPTEEFLSLTKSDLESPPNAQWRAF